MNKIGNLEKFVLENIGTVVNINNLKSILIKEQGDKGIVNKIK
jgi:hypothetical protein